MLLARQSEGPVEKCENTGFETRVRQECKTVTDTECETVDKVKYRTEIVPECKTKVVTDCSPTTINIPKEECVQAFEKKCETDYKIIDKHSLIQYETK